ncbi:MAG: YIP1 family protein [Candidatus Eiseniibacteriota bacterium]
MEDVTPVPSAPAATPASSAPWPFPKRFAAVFTSPRALFEHLAERPTWLAPMILAVVLIAAFILILWDPVMLPETIEKIEEGGQNAEQGIEMMTTIGRWITLITGVIGGVVVTFIWAAAVFFVGGFLLGGKMSYKHALSLVTHAGLVAVPGLLVRIPLALFSKTAQVSIGPGAFFPPSQAEGFAAKFFANVLFNLDLFTIWQTALVALGVAVIARVPKGRANLGIWGLFAVFVLLGSLAGAVFQP